MDTYIVRNGFLSQIAKQFSATIIYKSPLFSSDKNRKNRGYFADRDVILNTNKIQEKNCAEIQYKPVILNTN